MDNKAGKSQSAGLNCYMAAAAMQRWAPERAACTQVTTYKAITVGHGAHQDMKRGESIPEGSAVTSRGSGRNASGRGSGSSGTNRSAGPRDDLMETWWGSCLLHSILGVMCAGTVRYGTA